MKIKVIGTIYKSENIYLKKKRLYNNIETRIIIQNNKVDFYINFDKKNV